MAIRPAAAPGQAGRPLHLQTARLRLAPLHSRSPAHPREAARRVAAGRGVGGGEEGDPARGRGGGRGGRRYCPGGGGRREGAAAAAAAASPAATQTPGAAEAVSCSAFPPILWSQGTSELRPGRVCGGPAAPGAAAGGTRALGAGRAQGGGWGREEPRGPGDPVPAAIPGAAHPVSSLVLPSVPLREKKTKPKPPRMGGRKGESNFGDRRAKARGAGRMGARWVGRGRSCAWWPWDLGSNPSGRGLGSRALAGSRACRVGPERLQEACVGCGDQGRGLWEPPKAVVEPRGGSSMHLGLRT